MNYFYKKLIVFVLLLSFATSVGLALSDQRLDPLQKRFFTAQVFCHPDSTDCKEDVFRSEVLHGAAPVSSAKWLWIFSGAILLMSFVVLIRFHQDRK